MKLTLKHLNGREVYVETGTDIENPDDLTEAILLGDEYLIDLLNIELPSFRGANAHKTNWQNTTNRDIFTALSNLPQFNFVGTIPSYEPYQFPENTLD